ncbi:hypothetical protein SKAU_G00365570 [Synaphobranchus kaupii]|uniref:Uncharacterized protein n=1 Tax=Synaphobranchus kaupii TaxID=118154 RepID=A0A9Q1IFG6_SYNKA|nr:hypothetical protein SKAU_G00365570 [Synaphobranchus kaupii]
MRLCLSRRHVDGHVLLACSVDGGDDVRLRWTSVLANLSQEPAAQKSTGRTPLSVSVVRVSVLDAVFVPLFWQLLSGGAKRMQPALLRVLLVLAAVSHGTTTFCNITEGEAQCYGAVGQSVFINLTDISDKDLDWTIRFNKTDFFRYRKQKPLPGKACQNHCHLLRNMTLRLDNLTKDLSGPYSFEVFDANGKSMKKRAMSLTIQGNGIEGPREFCLSPGY